jgi:cytochrome bd-type quinol oxidase subunit 2
MLRFVRLYSPALAVLLLFAVVPSVLAAPANPAGVTASACSFSSGWFDGLSRWLFGVSLVIFLLVGLLALRNVHQEGPWGVIVGLAGVGLVLGLVALLPSMAPIALAAAGAPACP